MKKICLVVLASILVCNLNAQNNNTLERGQALKVNSKLISDNGAYYLIIQPDGNLCIYTSTEQVEWCADSQNSIGAGELVLQKDGNLVVKNKENSAVWASKTHPYFDSKFALGKRNKPAKLVLVNNGTLALYNKRGIEVWSVNVGSQNKNVVTTQPKSSSEISNLSSLTTENFEEKIFEIEDIEVEEVEEDIEVPFAVIQNVPIYPGCETGNNNDKRKCMSSKIATFVKENFNTKIAKEIGLSGRIRLNAIFRINEEGHIVEVITRAPHPRLGIEAKRVINLIPKMQPGKHRGQAVIMPYSLPIIFEVND